MKIKAELIFLAIIYLFSFKLYSQNITGNGYCSSIFKAEKIGCDDIARANSIGGSFPILYDAFNVVSASLPTFTTPVGIEAFYDTNEFNYSMLKGFDGVGTGLSISNTSKTFFSPANNLSAQVIESGLNSARSGSAGNNGTYTNLGTAFNLFGKKESFIQSTMGFSARYIEERSLWAKEGSFSLKTKILNLGYSLQSRGIGEQIQTLSVGLKFWRINSDYVIFMDNMGGNSVTTRIFSINLGFSVFHFTYALRTQTNPYYDQLMSTYGNTYFTPYTNRHHLYGATFKFWDKFTIGWYMNYVLNKNSSIVAQYFF